MEFQSWTLVQSLHPALSCDQLLHRGIIIIIIIIIIIVLDASLTTGQAFILFFVLFGLYAILKL